MFAYPPATEVNRPLPKTRIFTQTRAPRAVQAAFSRQIADLVWRNKLAPETLNLPARDGVWEIQVIEVVLKSEALDPAHLARIDKAIPSPLLFRLSCPPRVCFAAAHKRPHATREGSWVVGEHFLGPWLPEDTARDPLPVALDLAGLYDQLLRRHLPVPARPGESLADHLARLKLLRGIQATCDRLETDLRHTRQFNRRVDLNTTLKELRGRVTELTNDQPLV